MKKNIITKKVHDCIRLSIKQLKSNIASEKLLQIISKEINLQLTFTLMNFLNGLMHHRLLELSIIISGDIKIWPANRIQTGEI